MTFLSKIIALTLLACGVASAQVPISGLPPATLPLGSNDQLVVNQLIAPSRYSTRQAPVSAVTSLVPPLSATYILESPNALIPNSRTLQGTANQVILSDGGPLGNLTLSLPQSICVTCGPTFSSLTITGVLNGFSGVFSSTLQSNGYTGTTGNFSGALSADSLTLTNPLPATSGGTGFGVYAIGDLLTASATNTLSKLSDVAAGSYLRSGGVATVPGWSTLTLPNAATTGDLLIATGTNAIGNLADASAGKYLRSAGAGVAPAYSTTTIPNTAILGDIWYGSAGNVVSALAGNTTSAQQFLSQTGTGTISAAPVWSALPGSFSGFATPTGKAALTATAGVATTGIRSDANIAIDQTIAPTWTGTHTFATAAPITIYDATGAAADTKNWDVRVSAAGTFAVSTATDAAPATAVKNALAVGRTTTAISTIDLGNSTDQPTITAQGKLFQTSTGGASCPASNAGSNTTGSCFNVNVTGHTAWTQVIAPLNGSGNELGLLIDGGTGALSTTDTLFRVDGGNFSQVEKIDGQGNTVFNGSSLTSTVGLTLNNARPTLTPNTSSVQMGASAGGIAQFAMSDSAGAADSKMWDMFIDTTTWNMRADNDANNSASTWLRVTRSGLTITDITTASSAFHMTGISTTASAANMFIDNASGNNILRSTSSLRYKQDVTPLEDAWRVVNALKPVRFHSKATADDHKAWFYGLIAEDVAKVEPSLIVKDPEGRPDGVQYDRVQVFMLPVVQSMHRQIQLLWACIALLAIWNVYLTVRKR